MMKTQVTINVIIVAVSYIYYINSANIKLSNRHFCQTRNMFYTAQCFSCNPIISTLGNHCARLQIILLYYRTKQLC